MYYNSKKDPTNGQNVPPPSQTSGFLQMPINFSSFKNKNKKNNVTRSNTTSTNNSMSKLVKVKQRKRSAGTGSLGLKNADSSTGVSRDDLASLQSEALSFGNYKSTPIAVHRKFSFRDQQTPADDQQSLINFEKFPDLAQLNQLNQLNSISSSIDSSTNQPMMQSYMQGHNPNNQSSRFSVYKSQHASPQPHQLASQLNQKLALLEKNNQQYANYANYANNYHPNSQADDALSTVSQISTISGLQMNSIPNYGLERSNSRLSDTKINIDEPATTAIFNINNLANNALITAKPPIDVNTLVSAIPKEIITNQSPSVTYGTPMLSMVKVEDPNELDKISENDSNYQTLEENATGDKTEKSSNMNSNYSTNVTSTAESISNQMQSEPKDENQTKDDAKQLDKKLSVDSIYEPNSSHESPFTNSQESLSPFQSNQSTVTSFADFLQKKVEGRQGKDID